MNVRSDARADRLAHILDHLGHLLPAQGPIGVFIHHNTLHAFQNRTFHEAVTSAAELFQAEPYLTETSYREAYRAGRIRDEDLDAAMAAENSAYAAIWRRMLTPGVRDLRPETVRWEASEGSLAADAATVGFSFWLDSCSVLGEDQPAGPPRPRDGVQAQTGEDIDDAVHPLLIRLAGGYLDQGLAYWPMPNREQGLWKCAVDLLRRTAVEPLALRGLRKRAAQWSHLDASHAVMAALEELDVEHRDWEPVLQAELLALPGWAGLFRELENNPALAPHESVPARLLDFLAVRMLLTVSATAAALGDARTWRTRAAQPLDTVALRLVSAARYYDAARLVGFDPLAAPEQEIEAFCQAVDSFSEWERRRIWHAAYERRHERMILLPLQQHLATRVETVRDRVAAQVFFCIDDREESIRRHLEETDPDIETYGAAGFFGVAMNYTGLDDPGGVSLCPIVVTPAHAVTERPVAGEEASHGRRRARRRAWASVARHASVSSRTLVRGWLGTTVLGLFTFIPLAARVLSPRRYAQWIRWLNASVLPEPRTELTFERDDAQGHAAAEGLMRGFTVAEKVERVASVLGPAGLRKAMARLVVVLGHGSTSLNNPHESAYDCGACGGRRGGPNARIFAAMANHPEVRRGLRERGILIPEDTRFVGGYHDTCSDAIDFYDLDAMPPSHAADFERLRTSLDAARAANAQERSRRFESAPRSRRPAVSLRHVQERSEHLAEPRPEYGHSANAVCIVGRRNTTRGLFLDRRAFLVSYDALHDPDDGNLARVLGAVIPVCGGISLEYFFSTVDNERYGCGTKLPHNVTGLLGVMNGYESDLRTGLTRQMIEIHEAVRILFVVETTPERVLRTIHANPLLQEFLENRWIRLATVDPVHQEVIHMYRGNGVWEPVSGRDELLAEAATSFEWFRGRLEHLPVARIRSAA